MKKISCFIIVIIFFLVGVTYCKSESCALTQSRNMSMGEKAHISISSDSPIHIHFPDGKGKARVNLTNIVSSGIYFVKEGYSDVEYPFSNDPNYNNLGITFVNIFLKDSIKNFLVIPGQTSVSFDVELSEDYDEDLSISLKSLIYEGHVIKNTAFDIEVLPTDSWIPKTEETPDIKTEAIPKTEETPDIKTEAIPKTEEAPDIKTEAIPKTEETPDIKTEAKGKVCEQESCYSNKCEIIIDVKDQKKVRLYRKSSPKGKYKLVKQLYNGEEVSYEILYDKGLKPNKQYWYKIQTLDWDSKIWSKKSFAKSYWTAPEKVKVKRLGNTLRWNKVKGAVGYMVVEYWHERVGYNIFWQILTDYCEKVYLTKKRTYVFKHQINDYEVYAIAKHNGWYYSNGNESGICKKMSGFKHSERNRYVG